MAPHFRQVMITFLPSSLMRLFCPGMRYAWHSLHILLLNSPGMLTLWRMLIFFAISTYRSASSGLSGNAFSARLNSRFILCSAISTLYGFFCPAFFLNSAIFGL